jgi:hypothetical protein
LMLSKIILIEYFEDGHYSNEGFATACRHKNNRSIFRLLQGLKLNFREPLGFYFFVNLHLICMWVYKVLFFETYLALCFNIKHWLFHAWEVWYCVWSFLFDCFQRLNILQ